MFSSHPGRKNHIISIIERPDSTETRMTFPGDITLDAAQGQLHINGKEGLCLHSEKNISQSSEDYTLLAKKAMFGIDSLSAVGSSLVSKISNVQTYADTVETVVDNMLQRLKNSIRFVEGVDQTKSRDFICTVKNLYSMRTKQAAILARKDLKIDAERIHMG